MAEDLTELMRGRDIGKALKRRMAEMAEDPAELTTWRDIDINHFFCNPITTMRMRTPHPHPPL